MFMLLFLSLPPSLPPGKVYSEGRVVDVLDKKSGASIIVEGLSLSCSLSRV